MSTALVGINTNKSTFKMFPKELHPEIEKNISSTFQGNNSQDVIRGLTTIQEKAFLPTKLGLSVTDITFNQKVKDYWKEWTFKATIEGTKLNTAFEVVDFEGEKIEKPVNLEDYITYKMCLAHGHVATTKEELENSEFYDFVMTDFEESKKEERIKYKAKETAERMFALTTQEFDKNRDKINYLVDVYLDKGDERPTDETDIKLFLDKKKSADYDLFNERIKDEDLEYKALVVNLIDASIITKEGNTLFYLDESLGTNKEAVAYLKNQRNQKTLLVLKEQLKNKKR